MERRRVREKRRGKRGRAEEESGKERAGVRRKENGEVWGKE